MQVIDVGGRRIGLLGDPHLGRRFVNNVPLHRRGEHEAMVNQGFKDHLIGASGLDLHVCMGDLFDRPVVTPEMVLFAADTYIEAVRLHKGTEFVVLAGNHDLSRDTDAVNSFDLFARLVTPFGVKVIRRQATILQGMLFVPYSPTKTSDQMVCHIEGLSFDAAFGHWDLVNPSSTANLVPKLDTKLYVTGHDHLAREEKRHGIRTICTGSMQAYAHGEGHPYVTVTLAELNGLDTKNLCVRVVLKEDEDMPEIDALQVSMIREKVGEELDLTVGFEGFDMATIFTETMGKHGVASVLSDELFERYRSRA